MEKSSETNLDDSGKDRRCWMLARESVYHDYFFEQGLRGTYSRKLKKTLPFAHCPTVGFLKFDSRAGITKELRCSSHEIRREVSMHFPSVHAFYLVTAFSANTIIIFESWINLLRCKFIYTSEFEFFSFFVSFDL